MTYEAAPALFDHCVTVYEAFKARSKMVEIDGEEVRIFEGFGTKVFTVDLHLSLPYYTSVMTELQNMDCVRQLKRGGGPSPSQWQLVQRPTAALWELRAQRPHNHASSKRTQNLEALQQQIRDMSKQIEALYDFTGAPRPL